MKLKYWPASNVREAIDNNVSGSVSEWTTAWPLAAGAEACGGGAACAADAGVADVACAADAVDADVACAAGTALVGWVGVDAAEHACRSVATPADAVSAPSKRRRVRLNAINALDTIQPSLVMT